MKKTRKVKQKTSPLQLVSIHPQHARVLPREQFLKRAREVSKGKSNIQALKFMMANEWALPYPDREGVRRIIFPEAKIEDTHWSIDRKGPSCWSHKWYATKEEYYAWKEFERDSVVAVFEKIPHREERFLYPEQTFPFTLVPAGKKPTLDSMRKISKRRAHRDAFDFFNANHEQLPTKFEWDPNELDCPISMIVFPDATNEKRQLRAFVGQRSRRSDEISLVPEVVSISMIGDDALIAVFHNDVEI